MTRIITGRRAFLAGLAAAAFAPGLAGAQSLSIKVGDRDLDLTVVRPAAAKGVILFSHAASASPDLYAALFDLWSKAGFMVVAPLHVDSRKHPRVADYTLQTAFPARIADLAAAGGFIASVAPGLPVAAAGHSYGSLGALIRAGALEAMIHGRDPATRAVVSFSTPGLIPGLIGPDAFTQIATPSLMITGDIDLVPGFVSDARAHLAPFETSPAGGRYVWIGKGVDHSFGGAIYGAGKDPAQDAALDQAAALSVVFLKATLLDDAPARAALAAQASTPTAEFRRR